MRAMPKLVVLFVRLKGYNCEDWHVMFKSYTNSINSLPFPFFQELTHINIVPGFKIMGAGILLINVKKGVMRIYIENILFSLFMYYYRKS